MPARVVKVKWPPDFAIVAQGLFVFPCFRVFRPCDVPGQNDLLGNLIKLSLENPRSSEN